ncbi:hypothetical protein [Paenibacillus sp. NPDC058071]|uniref:hypothetical protein n=1 Tax=Paenibacillus sp. NPDC058071 TaxID=3346326 RepID=UPI0036DA6087
MIKRHVLNRLLLLRLIQLAGVVNGATRLQKLIFKAESIGRDQNIPTFNYRFIRWHYGPYSEELKSDLNFLIINKLIIAKDNEFTLTPLAKENMDKVDNTFEQLGSDALLSMVLDKYAEMNFDKLLSEIYKEYSIETNYETGDTVFPVIDEEAGELSHV